MTDIEPGLRSDHWTEVYRTRARSVYETEAPIFDNPALTGQELELADEAARRLGTRLRSPILDLACGPGRHALALTVAGHAVVGVDHSEGLLAIAAAGSSRPGRRPDLVCGDIRSLPFVERSFRSALLLGKSFGYFSDDGNLDLLRRVAAVLEPGGFVCVELPNREPYLASMEPVETEVRPRADGETLRSEYRCRWRAESRRLEVRESHVLARSGATLWEGVWDSRLYSSGEIARLVRSAGFREVDVREVSLVEAQGAKGDVLMVGARR